MNTSQYSELTTKAHDDILDFFNERLEKFAFASDPRFYFQSNTKQKKSLIKISKIPEQYHEKMGADLIVQVNLEYFDAFRVNNEIDNINEILFDQELDKIEINGKTGKISLKSRGLKSSPGIIEKYTYENVARAEEVELLYEEQ